MKQMLAGDLPICVLEKRYCHKQGHTLWINLTASLVRNDQGHPDYFIAVIEDIGQRKSAEQALEEQQQILRGLADMASDYFWEMDEALTLKAISPLLPNTPGWLMKHSSASPPVAYHFSASPKPKASKICPA